jgi:hypothetical protein
MTLIVHTHQHQSMNVYVTFTSTGMETQNEQGPKVKKTSKLTSKNHLYIHFIKIIY